MAGPLASPLRRGRAWPRPSAAPRMPSRWSVPREEGRACGDWRAELRGGRREVGFPFQFLRFARAIRMKKSVDQ